MGQSLSEPKTEKETVCYENGKYVVAVSGMQGWRPEMEDAWSVQLPLCPVDTSSAYFAVFDGHGSKHFSAYSAQRLHHFILENPRFCKGEYEVGLRQSFHGLDLAMQQDEGSPLHKKAGGTTAAVALIKDSCIFCANVGDSRAIASRQGKLVELSQDHKPSLPAEERRIYQAGGWVEFNRVNGNLALSRALGDFEFKKNTKLTAVEQMVIADPDIITIPLSPQHEFLVVACDGVWDVMTNMEVLEFVRKRIAEKMKPAQICERLLDQCLAPDCRMGGVGCDNMTVILACFLHDGTYSDLAQRCSQSCPSPPLALQTPSATPGTTSTSHYSLDSYHHTLTASPSEGAGLVSSYCHTHPSDLRGSVCGKGGVVRELKLCAVDAESESQTGSGQAKPQQLSCTV